MKKLILSAALLATSSYGLVLTPYTPFKDGFRSLEDVATYEFTPANLSEKKITTADGHKYVLVGFDITRQTRVLFDASEISYQARAIVYDEDRAEKEYREALKHAKPHELVGKSYTPEYATFSVTLDDPSKLTFKDFSRRNFSLKVSERYDTTSPVPAGFRGTYQSRNLQLKRVELDEATGLWTRVVIGETLYTELLSIPVPVSNGSPGRLPR